MRVYCIRFTGVIIYYKSMCSRPERSTMIYYYYCVVCGHLYGIIINNKCVNVCCFYREFRGGREAEDVRTRVDHPRRVQGSSSIVVICQETGSPPVCVSRPGDKCTISACRVLGKTVRGGGGGGGSASRKRINCFYHFTFKNDVLHKHRCCVNVSFKK